MIYSEYPFESQYLDVFGSKMHYVEAGSQGPTVLFLHGTPSWSYVWRNIIGKMQNVARCVAIDMIGHGKSDFPSIEYSQDNQFKYLCEFIKKMDFSDLIIVGHSYGANLAAWYARTHNKVKAIAYLEPMLGSFTSWEDFNPYTPQTREFFKKLRTPESSFDSIINDNAFMQAFTHSSMKPLSEETLQALKEPFLQRDRRKVLWDGGPRNLPIEKNPGGFSLTVDENFLWIKKGNIPQLLFYTEPAAFFLRSKAEDLIAHTPHLTGCFLGKGKYLHMEDYPEKISHQLIAWITGITK